MYSVLFPGQGSQTVGMCKKLYQEFDYVKKLFLKADQLLELNLSKLILEGPKENLDLTENTQPAIFLASYSIFEVLKKEKKIDISKISYFAGHSLGEYSALTAAESINFEDTIKLLKLRGKAMQTATPKGEGGMIAVLGAELNLILNILNENEKIYKCYVANDNTIGQVVISGKLNDLNLFSQDLKKNNIKNIKLPVSAPFHCELMKPATEVMKKALEETNFKDPTKKIISNVTALESSSANEIRNLLIQQIESPVKWRESINFMIKKGVTKFIEIGPGKVLSGLIKRIDRNINTVSLNEIDDIQKLIF